MLNHHLQNAKKPLARCKDHLYLWKLLNQHSKLKRLNFREYVSIGHTTVEFCSKSCALIVELEGFTDILNEVPASRDQYLQQMGFLILRYEMFVLSNFPEIILEDIISQARRIDPLSLIQ